MFSRSRLLGLLLVGLAASLLLVVGVALAVLPPGGTFTDDNGNTHEGNIEAIAAEGITLGCNPPTNDKYCPTRAVTRGQMAAFLNRAFNFPPSDVDYFTDDNNSIFENDINAIAKAGITNGCNPPANNHFCPDGIVTREQMAAFLNRMFKYPAATIDYFNDDDNSIFQPDINAIANAGITLGCNPPANNKYCPSGIVARDQMASFLARAMGLTPIIPPPPPTTTTTTKPTTTTTKPTGPPTSGWDPEYCTYDGIPMWGSVYLTDYEFLSDVSVYETSYSFLADLVVTLVDYEFLANSCGKWYLTDYEFLSDFTVYVTDYEFLSDLSVYVL